MRLRSPASVRSWIAGSLALVGNVALAALWGWFMLLYFKAAQWPLDASGHVIGLDFMVFWTGGALTAQGHLAELFDAARFHALQEALFAAELPVKPRIWASPPPCS